jgi:hypothetical protein
VKQESNIAEILKKLKAYKRKYYLNKIVKGLILNVAFFLFILLISSWLEYQFEMESSARTAIFVASSLSISYFFIKFLLIPSYHLAQNGKHLSDSEAAVQIGRFFPDISDKLLNIIQLNELTDDENSLIKASINQKSEKISLLNFKESINIKQSNSGYLPYVAIPSVIIALILMFAPNMITEGSYRIIKFNKEFIPQAPFTFIIENDDLTGFKGENFKLKAKLEGNELPHELFVNKDGIKQRFERISDNEYLFVFKKLQKNLNFELEAAGYKSENYQIRVFEKPQIQDMNITLDYPVYIGAQTERLSNSGNLIVPEGTKTTWLINSKASDRIAFQTQSDSIEFEKTEDNTFNLTKAIRESSPYTLNLFNREANYHQNIYYSIEVIKDKYPEITLNPSNDSTYFSQVAIAGEISDDYGFSRLELVYSTVQNGMELKNGSIPLSFDRKTLNQKYFKLWEIDSFLNSSETTLEYYVQVADNDGINGSKYSKSATYTFRLPNEEDIKNEIQKTSQSTENQLDKSIEASKKANKQLQELEEILKTKRNLDWEDKKLIQDIFQKREDRRQELERIKNELEKNQSQRNRFNKQDPQLQEKSKQLQELMEEMLQDENEELMEKIKSLLEEQSQSDEFRESVEELKKQEKNKLKEMERLMELFKRMEIQYDMKQVGKDFEALAKEQKELAKENEPNSEPTAAEEDNEENQGEFNSDQEQKEALDEQEELNKKFEALQDDLRAIEERNQSLKQPNQLQDTQEQESEISLSQQNSLQKIQENDKEGASDQQQKSSEQMQKMSEMLSSMQMSMEMETLQENIDDLRNIVDNLLKLSFRQEALMKDFRAVNPSDPRFITLSEQQLAMQEDSRIVEDSLNALANRVFQLKNFINKELDQMTESMESSLKALRERENGKAIGEQQFAMTAMNNLALMLDDVLEQMQMQSSMGMGEQSKGNQQTPSLSEMQQSLNQKTKELSQSQKQGRQLSEKLGELAAEQAQLRKMMEELEKQLNQNGEEGGNENGGTSGAISEEMEKIEEDLVNKRLNRQLIERQQKIVTRLLESEKAREEQEEKEERKGETATEYERKRIPNAFEEYIKEKEREIEQLRNVPPNFTPYYKNEINKYYNRLKSKENITR